MMNTKFFRLALVSALVLPLCLLAQTGTVRGFVYEQETGEPSIFTPVSVAGTTLGAQTDDQGYFSITRIPVGHYTLRIVYLGFDTLTKEVDVRADQLVSEKLYLKKTAIQMRPVEVTAEKREAQGTVRVGVTKLTPKQIERLPAIGGQADLAQYMQVVPGVVFPHPGARLSVSPMMPSALRLFGLRPPDRSLSRK